MAEPWELRCGPWQKSLDHIETVDAIITDPPYSERTHRGHDLGNRKGETHTYGSTSRGDLNYKHWSAVDVAEFVELWHPRCRGWFVAMTDHSLFPVWEQALNAVGRYVFAPLAFVERGSRTRHQGDGPACWVTWLVVSRPRSSPWCRWGTLPGSYVLPPGSGERRLKGQGGRKPLWLLRELVQHYSRPGDLVCDPCCGWGTTLVGALMEGRRAVGAEADTRTHDEARKRILQSGAVRMFETALAQARWREKVVGKTLTHTANLFGG